MEIRQAVRSCQGKTGRAGARGREAECIELRTDVASMSTGAAGEMWLDSMHMVVAKGEHPMRRLYAVWDEAGVVLEVVRHMCWAMGAA